MVRLRFWFAQAYRLENLLYLATGKGIAVREFNTKCLGTKVITVARAIESEVTGLAVTPVICPVVIRSTEALRKIQVVVVVLVLNSVLR